MQFYTFELDDESKKLCTISTTPFGNYEYQRLPMGCSQSPDIAQEIMGSLLSNLEDIEVYINDIGVFSNDWPQHLRILDVVLTRLQANGFIINPCKYEWAVEETNFLGHWMTPRGIKPWQKTIDAILTIEHPARNLTQVRSFIGAVNFYRDMYPKRSHIPTPLHELTGITNGKQFRWEDKHKKAFDATMKALMARDAFVRFPDPNKPYHVYTDASDLQLGSVRKVSQSPSIQVS
jgi:Reverse transcriptase (RNA-dependent DNA polymerase)/RNase H-like domain found in reverse transcriptase